MQKKPDDTNQLHPTELHDQVTHDGIAPEAEVRSSDDAGSTPSAGLGAVETEVTPMTPPSANSDSSPDGDADTETYDPHAEIEGG